MDDMERRCNVVGVQALLREVVFGIFIKLSRIDQRVLYKLRRRDDRGFFGVRGLSAIILIGKSTNRLSPAGVSTSLKS